jgi:benzodiazapine receptor
VLFQSIGFLMGMLTQANIYPWYEQLNKSALTPPGFVFSIVWTSLYVLLAVIAWILWDKNQAPSKQVKLLFALQTLMNWAWTPLFFNMHWLIFSSVWLICLTCLNVLLIIKVKKAHKIIALSLSSYLLWLAFASYLNVVIALMN